MYINSRIHILSKSIMITAIIKLIADLCEGFVRFFLKKAGTASPDMLDNLLWHSQLIISGIQIIVTAAIFYFAYKKLKHYMRIVPEDDWKDMSALQEEYIGSNHSSLSISSVNRLLQLWAVIFVGGDLIYIFTSIMYRKFINMLVSFMSKYQGMNDVTFVILYNMTHGFKYLEILAALLLGVVMTGIFLDDHFLKVVSLVILSLFLVSFGVLQMHTFFFMGRAIGIVWTSIIYHVTETAGLFLLAFYLSKYYKGM